MHESYRLWARRLTSFSIQGCYHGAVSDENSDQNRAAAASADEQNDPINILSEMAEGEVSDEIALEDVDLLLQEEDPDFLKQISEIKVDTTGVDVSLMSDIIRNIALEKKKVNWKAHLRNLFLFNDEPQKLIAFWSLVVLSVLAVLFGPSLLGILFSKGLFLRSYAEWDSKVFSYNTVNEVELFYDNPRFAKNLMTMTKMFANIKSSENSGLNPMLAIEISVEGMSSEAIIELKDREAEFKDFLLREAEDFSYDELITAEGKKNLLLKFQNMLNANLTQGQVRRVLLKSFILKN